MIEIEEAWALIAGAARPLPSEIRPLRDAIGRIGAEPVRSPLDLPGFDRSAMDGYAVRAADTAPGSPPLRLVGAVAAGEDASVSVGPGEAAGITTGAALPPGADAVLRSELAALDDEGHHVTPAEPLSEGRFVRFRGEDVRAGDVLLEAGAPITLGRLSVLASAGVNGVTVRRPARVHLLTTGDELVPAGAPLGPGQIHDSNGPVLAELARRAGAEVVDHGAAPDDPEAIAAKIRAALGEADVLLISGGVSVGEHDHVKPVLSAEGVAELFWRVRIKPGKPVFCGTHGEGFVFGLPGNPLSVVVCFLAFVAPLLRLLQGGPQDGAIGLLPGRLAAPADAADRRTTFLTARLHRAEDGVLEATPTTRQGSHMTGALAEADGFAVIPHGDAPLGAGARVGVLPL
ncbi:MAG: Molybdopterin molybdenumtransferase [uncultured Solirubrobacteraceae bacterium]|uniref:Molybdopterin molybdenumtransferase n=1 Tax=uncultured Solirubrobacteraceae bacterium TaxID=1162706 RepID=A0A6J4TFR0_9ACTN|nr:MAG: Molybdopterin molybdenumtransferase [uncultured Solirubrobacteraceae bacterium]